MLSLEFTLYRFVCDISTFAGLFSADEEGRCIPDTASFSCCWSRVPRAQQASLNPVQLPQHGSTTATFFKSMGSDMGLTFSDARSTMTMNGDMSVLTFHIRPSEYGGGPIPVICKGTLDPMAYYGKPKKNYAVKLRDASGEIIGRLIFSLTVGEAEDDRSVATTAKEEKRATSWSPSLSKSPVDDSRGSSCDGGAYLPNKEEEGCGARRTAEEDYRNGNGNVNTNTNTDTTSSSSLRVQRPLAERPVTKANQLSLKSAAAPPAASTQPPAMAASSVTTNGHSKTTMLPGLEIKIERVHVKPESITLDRPAPFLLEGEYFVKMRYGAYVTHTPPVLCRGPKDIMFSDRITAAVALLPPEQDEKLRFSVWENGKQVAGFSLNPSKFRLETAGQWKEYAVPFRYQPTQQAAALDVSVRRTMIPTVAAEAPRAHHNYTNAMQASTSKRESPQQHANNNNGFAPHGEVSYIPAASAQQRYPSATRNDYVSSSSNAQTPPRSQQRFVDSSNNVAEQPSPLPRGGSSQFHTTPVRQAERHRPHSAGDALQNSQQPSYKPPSSMDEHERYLSEVMARIDKQQSRLSRQRSSLMEDWMSWRDEVKERTSRSSSVAGRPESVVSATHSMMREESVCSVSSRRASTPLQTKSFEKFSLQSPYQPVYTPLKTGRRTPSVQGR